MPIDEYGNEIEETASPETPASDTTAADLEATLAEIADAEPAAAMPPVPPVPHETIPPIGADVAVLDAMLDELTELQDPWGFVNGIADRNVPMEHRHRFYQNFVALVAMRPTAEQDALIQRGQQVFRYRSETARHDVEQLRASGASATKVQASVSCDEFMAEMIYVPGGQTPIRYLKYTFADGSVEQVDRVQIGETVYLPPQTRLVETGTVLLPTGIEEYGDFQNLFIEVRRCIDRHVYVQNVTFRNIMADYVFLTWIHDKFDVVPYLRAQGEYGTGKTRVLQVAGALSMRPIMAGGATTAAPIFRMIERLRPCTLPFDEADFGDSDLYAEIIKILNAGYQRGFPVLRAERERSEAFDVKAYDCYGPKILSTRRRFSDQALESRCLSYTMPMVEVPDNVPLFLGDEFRAEAQSLRNKLLLWRFRNFRTAYANPRDRIRGLDARLNQILIPLIAVADNDNMRAAIVQHATKYQESLREDRRESWEGKIASALLWRFSRAKYQERQQRDAAPTRRVQLQEIVSKLQADYGDNFKVDSRKLGGCIRHTFGIETRAFGGHTFAIMTDADATKLSQRYAIPEDAWKQAMAVASTPTPVPPTPPPATNGRQPVVETPA